MPSLIKDEKIWNKAKEVVIDKYHTTDNHWGLITALYEKLGGEIHHQYDKSFSTSKIEKVVDNLGINLSKLRIKLADLTHGANVELEHGSKDPETDVTHNNPVKTVKIALAHLKESPDYYHKLQIIEKDFVKGQHLDDSQRKHIASMYKSNPGKWSVRSLADKLGVGKYQVEHVVSKLGNHVKTKEQIVNKQRNNARWAGKKLPKHIVQANHIGRNKQIETRAITSMEGPIKRWLESHKIKFKSQVEVSSLVGGNDPELGIVDFFIPGKKLIIEADGPRHTLANVKARNIRKDRLLKSHGFRMVRITPAQMSNLDSVLSNIF